MTENINLTVEHASESSLPPHQRFVQGVTDLKIGLADSKAEALSEDILKQMRPAEVAINEGVGHELHNHDLLEKQERVEISDIGAVNRLVAEKNAKLALPILAKHFGIVEYAATKGAHSKSRDPILSLAASRIPTPAYVRLRREVKEGAEARASELSQQAPVDFEQRLQEEGLSDKTGTNKPGSQKPEIDKADMAKQARTIFYEEADQQLGQIKSLVEMGQQDKAFAGLRKLKSFIGGVQSYDAHRIIAQTELYTQQMQPRKDWLRARAGVLREIKDSCFDQLSPEMLAAHLKKIIKTEQRKTSPEAEDAIGKELREEYTELLKTHDEGKVLRMMARKHHPDNNPDDADAHEKTVRINRNLEKYNREQAKKEAISS